MKLKRFFIIFILLIVSVFCFYLFPGNRVPHPISSLGKLIGDRDDSTQWHKIKRTKKVKGVALVVHGLNLKPERMQSIIAELNDAGIDVLNLSLRGHGNNYLKNPNLSDGQARLESFQTVTYRLWLEEIYTAYLKVRQRAYKKRAPVFFVGFSLGGLMGCDLLLLQHDVSYDRMILFAPALNITVEGHLLKALMPFPNMVIDSLSPIYYRSNVGTPMAAYKALFEAIDHFNKNANDKLNKPTLIFIDEKDEFVPFEKLDEIITQKKLDRWQVHVVRKDSYIGENISYHLIIDQDSVGQQRWKQMKEAIKKHFNIGT
jgi:alpha-beta hydrolase superfamily lysophospholipase